MNQTTTVAGDGDLTPRQLRAAQRGFALFSLLNAISFHLLTGNIIALYALRLGGNALLVGALYSFIPLGQILPLVGRVIVRRLGTVRTMGVFWIVRYILATPILAAALFAENRPDVGIWLILIGVVGFNIARGIAITGHNTIIGAITTDAERGSFLAYNQFLIHFAAIGAGLAMGLLLQAESSLLVYTLFLGIGIVTGFAAARVIFRFPEPPVPPRAGGFVRSVRLALRRPGVVRFIALLAASSFAASMVLPFLVLYVKQVYALGDNVAMLLTAIGSVGAITTGVISGFVIDRVGAKPLMMLFTVVSVITVMLISVAPQLPNANAVWIYLGAIFFLAAFGIIGTGSTHAVYYYTLTPPADRLNLGILSFLITGIPATLGAFAGGALLEGLANLGSLPIAHVYRVYFGMLVLAYVGLLLLTATLERLGAYRVQDVVGIFTSPRELRAMALLHKLKESTTAASDQSLVERLGDAHSRLAIPDLLRMLKSPRFAVRAEALDALSQVPLTEELKQALITEVEQQSFTTAHIAADLIGRKRVVEGVPALRAGMESSDVFLAGMCMVALARLGDRDSLPAVEAMVQRTANPRLLISGATALELFGSPTSVQVLLHALERNPSLSARDEIILSTSGILGMAEAFYPLYRTFLAEPHDGKTALADFIAERQEHNPLAGAALELVSALPETIDDAARFQEIMPRSLERIAVLVGEVDVTAAFRQASAHPATGSLARFRFFAAAAVAHAAWQRQSAVKRGRRQRSRRKARDMNGSQMEDSTDD